MSLAMTDHFFQKPTLERMRADIAAGKPLRLDPETRRNLIKLLRDSRIDVLYPDMVRAADIDYEPPQPARRPWWKRIFG